MQERNEMIAADYRDGRAIYEICREYGIQDRRVYQILREQGVQGIKRPRKDRRNPMSGAHERIGARLYDFYFDKGLLRQQAADKLGTTAATLRNMEKGWHNLTLFDLQDIAAFMEITIEELVNVS